MKMNVKDIFNNIKTKITSLLDENAEKSQIILTIIIVIMLNLVISGINLRIDLTKSGSYSLSKKSRETVSGLKDKFVIKVFFSKDLPAEHASVARYLKDLLQEYSFYGSGNFRYEFVKESNLEKEAADYGVQPVTSRELSGDQVKLRKSYMAVVLQHADLIEKINTLAESGGLEYEITTAIEKMTAKHNSLIALDKPVNIKLFMDNRIKSLPIDGIERTESMVRAAFNKCNQQNYEKLILQVIDTENLKDQPDPALQYGLNKIKWQQRVSPSGTIVPAGEGILGIIIEYNNKFAALPVGIGQNILGGYAVAGFENLDSKLNDALNAVISSYVKVGYVTGHGELDINDERTPEGAGLFRKLVSDSYEMVPVNLSEDIPDDVKVLIVNGPKQEFSQYEIFKLDQFLMKGRDAVFFIDSFNELNPGAQQNMFQGPPPVIPVNTGLEGLLRSYGVEVNKDIVLDKNCAKANLGNMIVDYPVVPIIRESSISMDSVITKYLKSLAMIRVSSVTIDAERIKNKASAIKLVSTSDESWLMTGRISFNPMMLGEPKGEYKSYPVAVSVSGKFESAFRGMSEPEKGKDKKDDKDGRPDTKQEKQDKNEKISSGIRLNETVQSGKSEIIVVGTSEITKSGFIVDSGKILSGGAAGSRVEMYPNSLFIRNMIDYLSGKTYSPEMRAKNITHNPLKKTSDNARFALKAVNIAGVPILVIISGIVAWRVGSIRKKKLSRRFSPEAGND
jgi:ABC-type uncharacterized transport system involved in gliding motility auxiliary subunit